jgi:hypothetical protein
MKRRALLRRVAAAGTCSLTAGCLAGDQPADTDDPTPTPTPDDSDTPAATDTPTDTDDHTDTVSGTTRSAAPSDTPRSGPGGALTVTERSCGVETDDASVTFDRTAVAITGTIWGNDACHVATLVETRLKSGTLTVVVASRSDTGTDTMCAECITEIDYEVDVAFDGALPDRVEVRHSHGESVSTVATADR